MSDLLRAAIRAHTEPARWEGPRPSRREHWQPPEREYFLAYDTETLVDQSQAFLVGAYCECQIDWSDGVPALSILGEGLIYTDEFVDSDPHRLRLVRTYAATHPAHVSDSALDIGAPIPGSPELRVRSRTEFVAEVMLPAIESRATIVAFNWPWDGSRISERWYPARGQRFLGGITLELLGYSTRDGRRKPKVWLHGKRVAPRRFLLELKAPTGFGKRQHSITGRALDLAQLSFALADRAYTLDGAAEAWGLPIRKLPHPELGRLSPELIDYCRRDVELTAQLYAAVLADFRRHPIGLDPIQAFSPATIARGYLEAMGIPPPIVRQPDFDKHVLGWSMASYYAGQVECLIR